MPMLALHDWQNFYVLTGTASATLIGLLFVAVSISVGTHLMVSRAMNLFRTFVNPILLFYFQVLLVSCLAVMPLQGSLFLGGVLMVLGSVNSFLALQVSWRILVLHRDDEIDFGHWIWHVALPLLVGLLFVSTAIGFLLGESLAPLGLSITDLLCLTIGLRNTWVLTIWLVLHQGPNSDASDEKKSDATA